MITIRLLKPSKKSSFKILPCPPEKKEFNFSCSIWEWIAVFANPPSLWRKRPKINSFYTSWLEWYMVNKLLQNINNLREKLSPGPEFEPGSPDLPAGAITTKPPRRSAGPSQNSSLIKSPLPSRKHWCYLSLMEENTYVALL